MNDNAAKWVRALRSGEYKQTTDVLMSGGAFCCLGVACDLYAKDVGGEWLDGGEFAVDGCVDDQELPGPVRDWLGLRDRCGSSDHKAALTEMNDDGYSFEEIARVIEEEPAGLFAWSPTEGIERADD